MNMVTFGAVLLLVGGLVHTIPPINATLTELFGGTPFVQIAVGILSVIIGILMLTKRNALAA